jgi:Pyruvate-formate lyase-activating enzyme
MKARFYEISGDRIKCTLCPHYCLLSDGQTGLCGARKNTGGSLSAENYGRITSIALDPIEKKPLYRFYPHSKILSVGSFGCNMKCEFCQNYEISQFKAESEYFSPEKLVETVLKTPRNLGVAFTYNEPLIGLEYILDCIPLLKRANMKVVLVSNGMINEGPLEELLYAGTDAWNIDLKSFNSAFYKNHGGDLETVKRTVERVARAAHVEVTTLIIPGENDSEQEISALSLWLSSISKQIPLHLSRFFPRYKMTDKETTDVEKLFKLHEIARENLEYVYVGNI